MSAKQQQQARPPACTGCGVRFASLRAEGTVLQGYAGFSPKQVGDPPRNGESSGRFCLQQRSAPCLSHRGPWSWLYSSAQAVQVYACACVRACVCVVRPCVHAHRYGRHAASL